ncbi:hypothetical protein D3C81_2183780 [compost metagenome]
MSGKRISITRKTALRALSRIGKGMHVALVAKTGRSKADTDARFVHHLEHVGKPFIGLTY